MAARLDDHKVLSPVFSLTYLICLIIVLFIFAICIMFIAFTNIDFENGRNINKLKLSKRFLFNMLPVLCSRNIVTVRYCPDEKYPKFCMLQNMLFRLSMYHKVFRSIQNNIEFVD